MSTRKSEPATPWAAEDTPTELQDDPTALQDETLASVFEGSDRAETLLVAASVRPHIRLLFQDLRRHQGAEAHAIWPKRRDQGTYAMYQKLHRVRCD